MKLPIGYGSAARSLAVLALLTGHARAEDAPTPATTPNEPASGTAPSGAAPAAAGSEAASADERADGAVKGAVANTDDAVTRTATTRATQGEAVARARLDEAKGDGKPELVARLGALVDQWKRLALALADAARAEARASAVEQESLALEESASRAEALLEQTEARRARALGRMQELGLSPSQAQNAPKDASTGTGPASKGGTPASTTGGTR